MMTTTTRDTSVLEKLRYISAAGAKDERNVWQFMKKMANTIKMSSRNYLIYQNSSMSKKEEESRPDGSDIYI